MTHSRHPASAIALAIITMTLAACASGGADPTPTIPPTATRTPVPATSTPVPAATSTPAISENTAIVVGGDVRVRSAPTTQSDEVATLEDLTPVTIARAVQGENWLVGTQTWVPTVPDWTTTWYELTDGTYIYAAFLFILQPGQASPLSDPQGAEKWIDVNVTTQTASAMIGDAAIYTAPVSSGSPQFPSPLGSHAVEPDGRIAVERMTSAQAGYNPAQARYDVERVLFTQYYDQQGDALHLNYWRPQSVFGSTATSHGCVGLQLHDAQYFWLFAEAGTRVEIHA
ncbi:MAG: L,D-transpeptidase family protein [Dehalococcoidia bacterium]